MKHLITICYDNYLITSLITFAEYTSLLNSSGAAYSGEPQYVSSFTPGFQKLLRPKSAITKCLCVLSNKRFSSFKSRWRIPCNNNNICPMLFDLIASIGIHFMQKLILSVTYERKNLIQIWIAKENNLAMDVREA